jgi:hypothetical protein
VTALTDAPAVPAVLPPPRPYPLRLRLLLRSVGVMLTSMVGVVLFVLWVTCVAVSPITLVAPLVLPVTGLVRAYANARRRGVARLLGRPVEAGYRTSERPGLISRIWAVERDPASWRDVLWLLLHAVVGFVTATLAVALFLTSVFYLIYPFLYWVTPPRVFDQPYGDWLTVHSVAGATVAMPLGLVSLALWFGLQLPLARAELAVTRSLLGR